MENRKKEKANDSQTLKMIIFALVIIIVISIIGVCIYFIIGPTIDKQPEKNKNINVIEGYPYTLSENDSSLYKEEFEYLKKNLTSDNIDNLEYAKSVAKMFIIDLYSINTKVNKYDIGGIEFIIPENQENFTLNVTNTIYKYVQDNSNKDRTQSLPVVSKIEIVETKEDKYIIEETKEEYPSYTFKLAWDYDINLGYDDEGEVIVINKDNMWYVVEKN